MNKKQKFTRIALVGALFLGIAGTALVGCKDYDDDIDALRTDVDANKTAIAANKAAIESIQAQIKAGYILTDVKSDGNGGIIVTLSNGQQYEIKKGEQGEKGDQGDQGVKGEKGDEGKQGMQGIPGEAGKAGDTPEFSIKNGHLIATWTDGSTTDCGELPVAKLPEIKLELSNGDLIYNGTNLGHVAGKDGEIQADLFKIREGILYYGEKELGEVVGAKGETQ